MATYEKQSTLMRLHIDSPLLLLLIAVLAYSLFIIWSASGQNPEMLQNKTIQIILGFAIMLFIAQFPPSFYEKIALPLFIVTIILLILVDLYGDISKGAQRWLDLGFVRFQPSEIAKIAVPLMVARFISSQPTPPSFFNIIVSLVITLVPTILITLQPDLGTSILVFLSGAFIIYLAGMNWRLIAFIAGSIIIFLPIFWFFLIKDYQRDRVLTVLNPELDPLGKGYHTIQSKIAIGSGGFWGKGWLQGTQSQLEFLPERHTDFIFAVLAEELGFAGILVLFLLYLSVIIRSLIIASQAKSMFGQVLSGGLILVFFVYIFVNIGMVSGLLPVVGVPLPLISYGGTSLIILMAGFGLIMSVCTHKK